MPKTIKLASLKPNPDNPRYITEAKFEALKRSIRDFPEMLALRPLVVDEQGMVLGGNMRLKALAELGHEDIPAAWVIKAKDLTEEQRREFIVKDNVGFGAWDWDLLANDWADEPLGDWGLEVPLLEEETKGLTDPDDVPELPDEPTTKPGDLWLLGEHRLLCGDSTKAEDVERLMAGAKADCVMTDPPYGMSYKGKVFGKEGFTNDGEGEFEQVLTDAVGLLPVADCSIAICFSSSRLDGFFRATSRLTFHRLLTIYKPNGMGYPWRGWILTSEVVGIFSTGDPSWGEGAACHDVYIFKYEDRPDRSIDHPTVKPLKIISDILQKLGGGSVYDPFLGSGTTLIAAEQLGRKCYGMEIDPKYCDVIVKRWEDFTGKKAKLNERQHRTS